ncbi:hypothetical protein [Sandarakinorhabdus sp. DWP1-3-1]|uniref:hypothetical protein n=1 Tax=Sandarakinorhabdus sp. DWP1-3-1 TaxID=2804627 RepID=UPI003CF3BE4C
MPKSFLFFAATGLLFLLQALPWTGIFLMFVGAPFWSVALVNAGFVGTGVEAILGRVSRGYLLLPVAWFGGYAVFAARDQATIVALRADVAANNAPVKVPFDPQGQALVGIKGSAEAHDVADGWHVQNYGLPVVYGYDSKRGARAWRSNRLVANHACRALNSGPGMIHAGIFTTWFHDESGGGGYADRKLERRFCMVQQPEQPRLPAVTVQVEQTKTTKAGMPLRLTTTTVTTPDGRRHVLRGGSASPLARFPMPIIGCFLNSGGPSWDCDAGFHRTGFVPLNDAGSRHRGDPVALASALGLRPVAPADRVGSDPAFVADLVAAAEARGIAVAVADLDRLIADPQSMGLNGNDFALLRARPEHLVPLAPRLMDALESAVAAGTSQTSAGRMLAEIVAALPDSAFVAHGPRILALYPRATQARLAEKREWQREQHWLEDSGHLYSRIGDLGPPALPVLMDGLMRKRRVWEITVGLCRMGVPAAAVAGPMLLARWATREPDRADQGLYLTLLRLGLRDSAGPVKQRYKSEWFKTAWATVTPASPREICNDFQMVAT